MSGSCRAAWLAVSCTLLSISGCQRSSRPEPVSSVPNPNRPAWVKQGIVMAGNWETLGHLLRVGGAGVDAVGEFKAERTEAVARKLKELGVTLVTTSFTKGMGLGNEAEDIEMTRQYTRLLHQQGIKVGGYVGSTLLYEAMFQEEPESRGWGQVNEFGSPIYYAPSQTHRIAACRNNPGYQAYVQKMLRAGIQDVGLDLIHFDQMGWYGEPRSCRCQYCRDGFREFIRARYTPEQFKLRYGFAKPDGIVPPPFDTWTGPIRIAELNNPLMQDWEYYRAASMARILGEYNSYIHKLNPEVAMDGNPFFGQGANNGFQSGTDLAQYMPAVDIFWTEDAHHASYTPDGRLISKIRTMKIARKMGRSIFMYTGGGMWGIHDPLSPHELRLAEALAYNGANLGMVGHVTPNGLDLTPAARDYINFFHAHLKDLVDTRPVADAAVLRAFASVEFNPARSLAASLLAEQTLIQTKIPFEIIFDRHLNELSKYRVLVLADQEALSDAQVSAIREYVRNGGGLVATGDIATLDEWRRKRPAPALADVLGEKTYGKGRVAYLAKIEPATVLPAAQMSYYFGNEHWKLPKNYADLAAAVKYAAGSLSATVQAPLSVTAELEEQPSSKTRLLHLVNYDCTRPVSSVAVSLEAPEAREVVLETPDGTAREALKFESRNGIVSFKVPKLKVYDLVLVR